MKTNKTITRCVVATLLSVFYSGCGSGPSEPPQNDLLSQGIFAGTTDKLWSSGVTNITFAKTKYGVGRIGPRSLLANALVIHSETNEAKIKQLIACFQTPPLNSPTRYVKTKDQWHVLIFSREDGYAHVVLDATELTNVYSGVINGAGTIAFIQECYPFLAANRSP